MNEKVKVVLKKSIIKDAKFLFVLRNKPYVYKNSGTPRPVEWQEHIDWLGKVLSGEANKELFIVKFEEKSIGQVRFDYNNSQVIVSVSLLKEFQGRGIAFLALQKAIKRISKERKVKAFLAEIHQENIASQKLFKKLGFQFQNQKGVWKNYILNT